MEPDRVDRVDFVLRAERVDGVRPEPVRVDGDAAGDEAAVALAVAVDAPEAMPQVSQYPSSTFPLQPGRAQVAMGSVVPPEGVDGRCGQKPPISAPWRPGLASRPS